MARLQSSKRGFAMRSTTPATTAIPLSVFAILCYLACLSKIAANRDVITSESLNDGATLVSSGETFELGFFRIGDSVNTYLGIWYKQVSNKTVVWVANRERPLTDSSGVLKIGDQGNVVLVNGSGGVVWSSNQTSAKNPVLQLLHSGNLVLREADGSSYLWQSFDYPSDTLLPGMKLGWDVRIGLNRKLTCWKSATDPSPGDYTFEIDPNGLPQAYLRRRTLPKYRSGPWNGLRFSGVPEMKPNYIFQFKFVANAEEVYYAYSLVNSTLLSRLTVTHDGVLNRFTWVEESRSWNLFWSAPKDQCDDYAECGPYGVCNSNDSPVCGCLRGFQPKTPRAWYLLDGKDGCVRSSPLECGKGDGFAKLKGMKLPDTRVAFVDMGMSLGECEAACRRNCTCIGYASAEMSGGGSGCVTWDSDLIDLRAYDTDGGQDLYVRLPASQLGGSGAKKRVVIIVAVTAATACALLSLSFYCMWKRMKKTTLRKESGIKERSQDLLLFDLGPSTSGPNDKTEEHRKDDLELLDLSTVVSATNNFSDHNKLGEGGFGPVYKGKLPDDQEIAVKKLSKNSGQGLDEFKNEMILIAKLQHRNLVRLLGCCIQGEEKMLVYEYMPNKSLDFFIFDEKKKAMLDWRKRFDVIMGIARGLLYLHQDSRFRIIHRDLKASNILLDSKMIPKISDFGMARIFGSDQTEANTKRVVGTYGYMSPEYAMDGLFSVKSDVFSFGVLVLEIVSGMKNRGFYQIERDLNLLSRAWRLWKEGEGLKLMDTSIMNDSCPISEVLRCIQVGLLCAQERAEDRPTMSTVVFMLGSENPTLPQPKQPGYCTGRNQAETDSSSSKLETSTTVNHVTVTMIEGR